MRGLITLFVLMCASHALATPGSVSLERATLRQLGNLSPGQSHSVAAFPAGPGLVSAYEFRRIEIYAPGARVFVIDGSGQHEIARSPRVHLLGYSRDGLSRIALSFDPDLSTPPQATGSGPAGGFVVQAARKGDAWQLEALSPEAALPRGVKPETAGLDDAIALASTPAAAFDHLLPDTPGPQGSLRYARIAVDTDVSFMSERFSNNTAQATSWIADLFTQMNIGYENDLNVQLQVGDTFLRTTTDPYANTTFPADQATLVEFGNYWQANYAAINRDFAMLLSGNSTSGNSAAGIAWLDVYCLTSGNGGSYSINQVFTNPGIGVLLSATLVAHELGHNFGAAHTHCTNVSTGNYPTGSNTIDLCSNVGSGCYTGPTSCPVSGPGAPRGSVMSYCNQNGCNQNVLQFHPTQITRLLARIAANTPSCLSEGNDLIFANGFE